MIWWPGSERWVRTIAATAVLKIDHFSIARDNYKGQQVINSSFFGHLSTKNINLNFYNASYLSKNVQWGEKKRCVLILCWFLTWYVKILKFKIFCGSFRVVSFKTKTFIFKIFLAQKEFFFGNFVTLSISWLYQILIIQMGNESPNNNLINKVWT